jgi:aminopeptidase N
MTKPCIVIICVLLASISHSQPVIDVQHYKYEFELSDASDSVKGRATITVKFLHPSDTLSFDFVTRNKGIPNMAVSLSMRDTSKKALLTVAPPRKLLIKLTQPAKTGDTASFVIEFSGIPFDGLIIGRNKFNQRTFFSDNWPDRAHYWIPCVDELTDKASVEFIVTAPAHYQVVSNGVLMEETNLAGNRKLTHWKEDIPLPTKVMVIGAADFAINYPGDLDCISLSSWVFPGNKRDGFYDYAAAREVLSFLIDFIGPYPFKKLANIQSLTIFGGMENASAIFYAESSITGRQNHLELIAHEITHQWFGNMATEKSFAHLWLSEGFATYLATLFIGKKYGVDSARSVLQTDRQQVIDFARISNRPVVDSVSPYVELLNVNSYQKGEWILHMLRNLLGEAIFQKGVRTYYASFTGKNAETRDLQLIFEKVSGKNLHPFFQQWLYTPGIPKLEMKWKYLASQQQVQLSLRQVQKSIYQFPLDLLIQTASGKKQYETIQVTQASQIFTFPVKEKPSLLKPDPTIKLLYEGSLVETR